MIGVKPLSFSIRWARPSSLHKIHKEKKQKPHHGFISCQVYKRGFQKNEERKRSEEENEEMPDIEQLSPGGPWNISPKEWRVIKRVCDKLFPEGIDWGEFWSNDDYEAWYPGWRFHLENEGGFDAELPQYEESIDGQRSWFMKALKYLETRSDFVGMMPTDWLSNYQGPDDPIPAKVLPFILQSLKHDRQEFDPDWNDWDWRSAMEKRKLRERERREWRKMQEELGKYKYVDTVAYDWRIPEDERRGYFYTDEEMWNVITQNGRAFDPRKDEGPWKELNPDELPDWAGEGVEDTEEIDEYLMKIGRMVDDKDYFEKENARLSKQPIPMEDPVEDVFEGEDPFEEFEDEETEEKIDEETSV